MKSFSHLSIRRSTVVLMACLLITISYIVFSIAYHPLFGGFDTKHPKPYKGFQFNDTLTCDVEHSTRDSGKYLPTRSVATLDEKTFSLRGLTTTTPEISWIDGKWELLSIAFSDGGYLTFSAPIGSFWNDYLGVSKTYGTFIRSFINPQGGIDGHFGAFEFVAQKGRCK